MKEIKGLFVDVKSNPGHVEPKRIDDDMLEAYYDMLQCSCIDIVVRKIGGKPHNIVCDDEGLFDAEPIISAIDDAEKPQLVGNLFICNDDGEGRLVSLTDADFEHISHYVCARVQALGNKKLHVGPAIMIG